MTNSRRSFMVFGLMIFFSSLSTAYVETTSRNEVTIKGTVIDPFCLLTMGMKGEGHRECAQRWAKAGMNLAFMDEKGKIYPILQGEAFTNPNDPIFNYVEKTVTVKGDLIESGGVSGIMIKEAKGD